MKSTNNIPCPIKSKMDNGVFANYITNNFVSRTGLLFTFLISLTCFTAAARQPYKVSDFRSGPLAVSKSMYWYTDGTSELGFIEWKKGINGKIN